jgi:hypothetical protein
MSVKIVGHVNTEKEQAYVLDGGQAVTFHTARVPSGEINIFYSPLNTWASITASKLGIEYSFMRNSTPEEVKTAVQDQKLTIIGVSDI